MKIGFDGKRIIQNFTGLGNYSRYIVHIVAEFHPKNKYTIFSPTDSDRNHRLEQSSSLSFFYPKNQLFKSLWRSFGIINDLKNEGIDVFHGLSNEIPFGLKKANIPSVVTIHDLIFLRFPDYYPFIDRKIYEFKVRYACKNADKIIAISEQTKRDLIHFFNVDETKIEVIYQNCNAIFYSKVDSIEKERIKKTYNLPDNFLLNVGTIETRKNALLTVKALKDLDEAIDLVIIGKESPYTKIVKDFIQINALNKRVHFLNNVVFTDLPGIYQQAKIFIYPSEFEGFGIPIVEALSSGVPVIAATGSCLEEAGGPGSVYVNPKDHSELAKQIQLVLKDDKLREKMIDLGNQHLKTFDNQTIADKLINLYKNLAKC